MAAQSEADAEYELEGDWDDEDFEHDDEFVADDEELKKEQAKLAEESPFVDAEDDSISFGVETMEKQERLCILPWLAVAKHQPEGWVKPADLEDEPKCGLEIEWVWGYRCRQVGYFHFAGVRGGGRAQRIIFLECGQG